MASFKRFEDIQAWQKSRVIARQIYLGSAKGDFGRDFELRSQIRQSAVSIMSNIAEGQGRRTDRDFANFLNIALGYIGQDFFDDLYEKLDEVGRMIFALSTHLRGSSSSTSQTSQTSRTS